MKTLQEVSEILKNLEPKQLKPFGKWTVGQTFLHLAQSVEYSMIGYPKSEFFLIQNTLGKLMKMKFLKQGYMKHNLNSPIPGAPELGLVSELEGLNQLLTATNAFLKFNQELEPHFFLGKMNKSEFDFIHAMHIIEHLQSMGAIV